jgi:hypothetical protein
MFVVSFVCLQVEVSATSGSLVRRSPIETNVMYFSLNLLRIKGLYMLRALLTHPQEVLQKRHVVYRMRMSVGCGRGAV